MGYVIQYQSVNWWLLDQALHFAMGVEQPQFVASQPALAAPVLAVNAPSYNSSALESSELEGEAADSIRPVSIVQGQASSQEMDAIFGGD